MSCLMKNWFPWFLKIEYWILYYLYTIFLDQNFPQFISCHSAILKWCALQNTLSTCFCEEKRWFFRTILLAGENLFQYYVPRNPLMNYVSSSLVKFGLELQLNRSSDCQSKSELWFTFRDSVVLSVSGRQIQSESICHTFICPRHTWNCYVFPKTNLIWLAPGEKFQIQPVNMSSAVSPKAAKFLCVRGHSWRGEKSLACHPGETLTFQFSTLGGTKFQTFCVFSSIAYCRMEKEGGSPVTNHRLKSYKNKGMDSDELRRRREEEGIQLRKQKREQQVHHGNWWRSPWTPSCWDKSHTHTHTHTHTILQMWSTNCNPEFQVLWSQLKMFAGITALVAEWWWSGVSTGKKFQPGSRVVPLEESQLTIRYTRMNHLFLGFCMLSEMIMTKPFDTVFSVLCYRHCSLWQCTMVSLHNDRSSHRHDKSQEQVIHPRTYCDSIVIADSLCWHLIQRRHFEHELVLCTGNRLSLRQAANHHGY